MANKTVAVRLMDFTGVTGLNLKLVAEGSSTVLNGAGDALTEGSLGVFTCTVTEALVGWFDVIIQDGSEIVFEEKLYIPGDIAGTYVVGSREAELRAAQNFAILPKEYRDTTDTNPLVFYWPVASLPGSAFAGSTKQVGSGSPSAIVGTISFVRTMLGRHLYSLSYNAADRPAAAAAGDVAYELTDGVNQRLLSLGVRAGGAGASSAEDIALAVYALLATSKAALLSSPSDGKALDVIKTGDFEYTIPVVTAADSELVWFIRATRNSPTAMLIATKSAGLTELGGATVTPGDAVLTRTDTTVKVFIKAATMAKLRIGGAWGELRERPAGLEKIKHEVQMSIRHSAGRNA